MPNHKKPTQLKILEGNSGKRPLPKNEIQPKKILPKCPVWLNKEGKKEFRRLSKKLYDYGLLTELDTSAFVSYCQYYGLWIEVMKKINKTGETTGVTDKGYEYILPEICLSMKYNKIMFSYLAKFGLSPSDRVGLEIDIGENKKEKTGIEKYLTGI